MSKEELPISGDRWSELRKGGVFVDGLIDDQITKLERYSSELNRIVQHVRVRADDQQMTNETERPDATELLSMIPEMYKSHLTSVRAYVRNVVDLKSTHVEYTVSCKIDES